MENYEEIGVIGRGSFGTVYKMQNRITKEYVAMKIIDKVW